MSAIPAPEERAPGYIGAIPRAAQGSGLGLALVVIASAQLMVVLDATIVNVALPHVQRALGFSGAAWNGWSTPTRLPSAGCSCSVAGRGSAGPAPCVRGRAAAVLRCVAARRVRHRPVVAAGRAGGAGSWRRGDRAERAGTDQHHLSRGPAAQPGRWGSTRRRPAAAGRWACCWEGYWPATTYGLSVGRAARISG